MNFKTVHVEGLKELESTLKLLREQFGVKTGGIIIRGMRAGAKLIRDDARRRVVHIPSGLVPDIDFSSQKRGRGRSRKFKSWEGMLRSNIVEHAIPVRSRLADGRPTVLVRVRNHGYRRYGNRLFFNRPGSSPGWWWWLEFGTSKMPARPFLRPAFEAQKQAAVAATAAHVRKEIDEFLAKTVKKAA